MFIRWPTHHQKLHEHVGRGLFTNLKGDGDAQWIMSIFFLPGGFLGGRRGWSTKSGPHGYELASQRFPVLTKNAIQRAIFAVPTGAGQGPGTGAGCSGLIATKTGHTWSQPERRVALPHPPPVPMRAWRSLRWPQSRWSEHLVPSHSTGQGQEQG